MSTPQANHVELYRKHRPNLFKEVLGQEEACRALQQMLKASNLPHAVLFTGPSGCGKTTLGRIVKAKLGCEDGDFEEVNGADFRGIDKVREIRTRMSLAPLHGKVRIWLIDECHNLSKDAQTALLKMLEDTPAHVYFLLATTEPNKLLKTIITRCTEIKVRALTDKEIGALLQAVATKEGLTVAPELVEKICECSLGSARMALVLLHKVIGIAEVEQQVDAVERNASGKQAIELARALMSPKPQWHAIAALIKAIEDEPEGIRRLVLGYMSSVALNSNNPRAFAVLEAFQFDFYASGKAGLILACKACC